MTSIALDPRIRNISADELLRLAGYCWLMVAIMGQFHFVFFADNSGMGGGLHSSASSILKLLEPNLVSKTAFATHLLLAVAIGASGMLQGVPRWQGKARKLHLWSGRFYVVVAFMLSLSSLLMNLVIGTAGESQFVFWGNTLNAFCVMLFAALTWMTAPQGDYANHLRWALRTFVVVSGLWFLQLGFGLWVFAAAGVAVDPSEPMLALITFGYTLLPLLLLELVFLAAASNRTNLKVLMSGVLVLLSLLTAFASTFAGALL